METIITVPEYIIPIIENLKTRNWIIHNFSNVNDEEIYDPYPFIINEEIEYKLILDVNIYQYILNSIKKKVIKDEFKDALSLLVFCQVSNIEVDPSLAIYEKVNYNHDDEHLFEIIEDLNIFEFLNNTHPDHFIPYILHKKTQLNLNVIDKINRESVKSKITKHSMLKEWKSLYLMVLVICQISENNSIRTNNQKLIDFVNWMVYKFRRSFVVLLFAVVFFGKKPLKRMMKYKSTDKAETKRNNIVNMTWDLYHLNRYIRLWADDKPNIEYLFASNDKAFSQLLKTAILCHEKSSINPIKDLLDSKIFEVIDSITGDSIDMNRRVYLSDEWTRDYRDNLINKYEIRLNIK